MALSRVSLSFDQNSVLLSQKRTATIEAVSVLSAAELGIQQAETLQGTESGTIEINLPTMMKLYLW